MSGLIDENVDDRIKKWMDNLLDRIIDKRPKNGYLLTSSNKKVFFSKLGHLFKKIEFFEKNFRNNSWRSIRKVIS